MPDESRVAANDYVLDAAKRNRNLYPFYYVWNDYFIPENFGEFVGIKWHRHADEPRYDYSGPACEAALEAIRHRKMPVTLEEEFDKTVAFIERCPGLPVIIPHCGALNGGAARMSVFFDDPSVYFDTAVSSADDLTFIADSVAAERIIFGSDVSGTSQPFFNFPAVELEKVRKLPVSEAEMSLILSGNIDRLVANVVT